MGWIPGWPQDPTTPKGVLAPIAVVLHRTYGGFGGDYSVGKQGIFQFLIGKNEGEYIQFMTTEQLAWHCNGANQKAFGVELTGTNEDPLTDWQVARLKDIVDYASSALGIPKTYLDPDSVPRASVHVNDGTFKGYISHRSVATDDGSSQHTDMITVADWYRVDAQPAPTPSPQLRRRRDMAVIQDSQGIYLLSGGKILPFTNAGDASDFIVYLAQGSAIIVNDGQVAAWKAVT